MGASQVRKDRARVVDYDQIAGFRLQPLHQFGRRIAQPASIFERCSRFEDLFLRVLSDLQIQLDLRSGTFVDAVDAGRPNLQREEILKLADGRIYTAKQAHEAGLIDRIGTLRQAVRRAKELADVDRARLVTYQRPLSWHPNIYAQAPTAQPVRQSINLININWPSWLRPGEAKFMYLWVPN